MNSKAFRVHVDDVLKNKVKDIFNRVPSVKHLIDRDTDLNEKYYVRHRIETVKRIYATAKTDALALYNMIDLNYDASRLWAKYLEEEMNHDKLFLLDVGKFGVSKEDVINTAPFNATNELITYLERSMRSEGPISAVAYSVCVEWNSEKVAGRVAEKVKSKYGKEYVKGVHAHTKIDENEDHLGEMLEIAEMILNTSEMTIERFSEILLEIMDVLSNYFVELNSYCLEQNRNQKSE